MGGNLLTSRFGVSPPSIILAASTNIIAFPGAWLSRTGFWPCIAVYTDVVAVESGFVLVSLVTWLISL